MAIVHIAMFEVVHAVTRRFESYAHVEPARDRNLSLDRGVAQAAHDTLAALYPAQRQRLDSLLVQDVAQMHGTAHELELGEAFGVRRRRPSSRCDRRTVRRRRTRWSGRARTTFT